MAVVRARTAPPYALILFVFLWVLSTGLAVLFYVQKEKSQDEEAKAESRLGTIASSNEQRSAVPDLLSQKSTPGATALGTAMDQLQTARQQVANDASAISKLRGDLTASQNLVASLNDQLKGQSDQVGQNKSNYDAAIAAANKSADDFKTQLTAANAQMADTRAALQAAVDKAEKDLSSAKADAESDRRDKVLQIEQLKQQVAAADNRIDVLQTAVNTLRPTNKTAVGREADGQIVRSSIGTGEVYINLGMRDHLQVGQTFAVYDPKMGVRFDSDTEAAGKGGIEVMDVGATESLCRITTQIKGQAITVGDLIANPIYHQDKNRQFHFVVIGDFDLDGDGVATAVEHDRLVRMIESWGGVIDQTVTTQTDFLVAGAKPAAPALTGEGADMAGSPADARAKTQQSYDDIVAEAKRSSVPILNANRFLAMIGYYNTTVVRY